MRVKINSTGEIKEVKQVGDKLFDKENNWYSLSQVILLDDWRPASELPKEKDVEVVMLVDVSSPQFTGTPLIRVPIFGRYINGWPDDINVRWWSYPPQND